MKLAKLIKHLLLLFIKHGNVNIDLLIEDSICQTECELGDIAYSPREKRVKLLSKGFK